MKQSTKEDFELLNFHSIDVEEEIMKAFEEEFMKAVEEEFDKQCEQQTDALMIEQIKAIWKEMNNEAFEEGRKAL